MQQLRAFVVLLMALASNNLIDSELERTSFGKSFFLHSNYTLEKSLSYERLFLLFIIPMTQGLRG